MFFNLSKVDVWVAPIEDRPGGLAARLEGLARAGANLEVILARQDPQQPGGGVVFVTPITGPAQTAAAENVGFRRADRHWTLRIEGPDQPGLGYLVTRTLAAAGISHGGMTIVTMRGQFAGYVTFYSQADCDRAMARLQAPI